MTYYSENGITVEASTEEDVKQLSNKLRQTDIDEVWASHRKKPEEALIDGLKVSVMCLTIKNNGRPVGMFGINPETMLGDTAIVWFLSSDDIERIKTRFLRRGKAFIGMFLNHYSKLWNLVDERNKKSIEWLKFLGASFGKYVTINGEKFIYFSFERRV